MKTQKAVKIFGRHPYEVAIGENGKKFSRSFINGRSTGWEPMADDICMPRDMSLIPAPYRVRLPL